METRRLGESDLFPTVIGFGTWGIGGPPFWKATAEDDAIAALRRAYELGVTCFDTAPVYGLGYAEELVAKALGDVRDTVIYATKVGLRWQGTGWEGIRNDLTPPSIRYEIEQSLRRLRTDVIDLYQVHWPDPNTPIAESFGVLSELRREGKIRHIGVSNYEPAMIDEARMHAAIVSSEPRYNLLDRRIEIALLPYCVEKNIGVLPYSPLASGLLTGKYTRASVFDDDWRGTLGDLFKPGVFERNIGIVERLKALACDHGLTLIELAIAWVAAQRGVSSVLVGANTSAQVEQNLKAAAVMLDESLLLDISAALSG